MTPSGLIFVFVFLVKNARLVQPQARGAGPHTTAFRAFSILPLALPTSIYLGSIAP
jgi:hypothetical protein